MNCFEIPVMNTCRICLNSIPLLNYVIQVNIDLDVTGNISKIRIEHDGRLPEKGWHIDKACISSIIITQLRKPKVIS